ncbi:MAG TPA: TlpA disulfide reductase family protein [Phnomibacter sp.]|nr:TlpA disulfide reductase family protein [Phnomibacter sp.]
MTKIANITLCLSLLAGMAQAQQTPAKPKSNLELTVDYSSISYPVTKIMLSYYNTLSKERYLDSVEVSPSGKAVFQVALPEPLLASVRAVPDVKKDTTLKAKMDVLRDAYSIYLEPGKISITSKDLLNKGTAKGSKSQTAFQELRKNVTAYDSANKLLYAKYSEARKNKDNVAADKAEASIDSLDAVIKETVYLPFIQTKGKNSPVALYALSQYAGYSIDAKKIEPLYESLDEKVKELPSGVLFKQKLDIAKTVAVGQAAPQFTQNDTSGVAVSLASFKGKYVLIDFWASWCGPCRAENPNVVKAFNKHKAAGFTVLGVSLDQPGAQAKWLKAIHDDKLEWTHVSDLQYWKNEVAQLYGVQAIPQNYLLDTEGKIIGKDLRGEELQAKLDELFKDK